MELSILSGRLDRAADALRLHGIDMWITLGRESHILGEPALPYLMPGDVLFRTALLVTREERVCICAPIESEEFEDSGLFSRVVTYSGLSGFETSITEALKARLPIGRIALNFSSLDPSSYYRRY